MKQTMSIVDLERYRQCPEKYRRSQADPRNGQTDLEFRYRSYLRKIMVRFYTELADGKVMTEAQLRRSWSTLWNIKSGLESRNWDFNAASLLNATMNAEERAILRGTKSLNYLVNRFGMRNMVPVIVDEPYSVTLQNGLVVTGHWDLVYKNDKNVYNIIHWSEAQAKQDTRFEIQYPLASLAFEQRYGSKPNVFVDYILGIGNYVDPVIRTPRETELQLSEITDVSKAFSQELYWRSIGISCNACPYKAACLGVTVVQQKKQSK